MSQETNEAQQLFKLRTQVAMKALQGILANPIIYEPMKVGLITEASDFYEQSVRSSFKIADEFIKQLGRSK